MGVKTWYWKDKKWVCDLEIVDVKEAESELFGYKQQLKELRKEHRKKEKELMALIKLYEKELNG